MKKVKHHTQNINTHVASGWCVNNTFAYADVSYPLRKYHGKAVFTLAYAAITAYATFSQQPVTELTGVQKKQNKVAENCHICLKEFPNAEDRKVKDYCN